MIKHHSPLGLSVLVMTIEAVLLVPLSVKGLYLNLDSWLSLPWWIYVAAFYSIFFATVVTYSLNYYAMSHVDSSKVALFIYLQPVVAGTLSVGVDEITPRLIISSFLILVGLGLSTIEIESASKVS